MSSEGLSLPNGDISVTNLTTPRTYAVDAKAVSNDGKYTTIQSAVTAALADGYGGANPVRILIYDGTYTEVVTGITPGFSFLALNPYGVTVQGGFVIDPEGTATVLFKEIIIIAIAAGVSCIETKTTAEVTGMTLNVMDCILYLSGAADADSRVLKVAGGGGASAAIVVYVNNCTINTSATTGLAIEFIDATAWLINTFSIINGPWINWGANSTATAVSLITNCMTISTDTSTTAMITAAFNSSVPLAVTNSVLAVASPVASATTFVVTSPCKVMVVNCYVNTTDSTGTLASGTGDFRYGNISTIFNASRSVTTTTSNPLTTKTIEYGNAQPYSIVNGPHIARMTQGGGTVTLAASNTTRNEEVVLLNTSGSVITIAMAGADALDGSTNPIEINPNDSRTILSLPDGSGWVTVSKNVSYGVVGTIDASAALEVKSTTKGLLLPRMTAVQASAIGTPTDGLMVYATDTDATFTTVGVWARVNGAWTKL